VITGIDHIEFVVKDIDEMSQFFSKLGLKEIRRTSHHGSAVEMLVPGSEGTIIEFHTGKPTEPPGINHIAFRVDSCESTADDLISQGVTLDNPPRTGASGRTTTTLRDPMYQRWQLAE